MRLNISKRQTGVFPAELQVARILAISHVSYNIIEICICKQDAPWLKQKNRPGKNAGAA
jgi:hypothetical protein